MLRFILYLSRAGLVVPARRLKRGPLLPSWTLFQEMFIYALTCHASWLRRCDTQTARKAMEGLAEPPYCKKRITSKTLKIGEIQGEWFTPDNKKSNTIIIYMHGGGYVFGSTDTYRSSINRLALTTGCTVFGFNYRLAPEHPFPAAIEDCLAVYRRMLADGISPKRLILAGDSAGGGLVLATVLSLKKTEEPLPGGLVLISPWTDPEGTGETITTHEKYSWGDRDYLLRWAADYHQGKNLDDPRMSPIKADLRGFPKMLVQVGSAELLYSEVSEFYAKALKVGVDAQFIEYKDMVHGFQVMPLVFPMAKKVFSDIGIFVK